MNQHPAVCLFLTLVTIKTVEDNSRKNRVPNRAYSTYFIVSELGRNLVYMAWCLLTQNPQDRGKDRQVRFHVALFPHRIPTLLQNSCLPPTVPSALRAPPLIGRHTALSPSHPPTPCCTDKHTEVLRETRQPGPRPSC